MNVHTYRDNAVFELGSTSGQSKKSGVKSTQGLGQKRSHGVSWLSSSVSIRLTT